MRTTMGKKRKHQYVSREQLLTKTSSQRNVRSDVVVLETNKSIGTLERRFCRKLQVPGERDILVALVQFNDICLMVLPEPVAAEAVVFSVSASEISGKKKKVCFLATLTVVTSIAYDLTIYFARLETGSSSSLRWGYRVHLKTAQRGFPRSEDPSGGAGFGNK